MSVRPRMLQTLVGREALRLRKNPSAILLLGLLTAIALLLSFSRPTPKPPMTCWIVSTQATPWIEHLRQTADPKLRVKFATLSEVRSVSDWRVYPPHDCAIEILSQPPSEFVVRCLYPGTDSQVLQPVLQWFWPATVEHFGQTPPFAPVTLPITGLSRAAVVERLKQTSFSELLNEEAVATILLIIVMFVTCCHLLVSFTSQDRERGTLTALALTPATPMELIAARYLFHLGLAWLACASIVGILRPAAFGHVSLWLTIALVSIGMVGVGTVIASLARTQSAAGVLALCYMLFGGVLFYLATKFSAFASIKDASFESHSFPLLFLSLKQNLPLERAPGLAKLAGLVGAWTVAANWLFRERGWK